jgi:hypothetical protein
MNHRIKLPAVAALAALTLGGTGAALAGPKAGGGHSDVSVTKADGSTAQYAIDRGKVTAAGGGSVTLDENGASVTIALGSAQAPTVGSAAMVVSRDGTALSVRSHVKGDKPAKGEKPAKGDKGDGAGLFKDAVHATITSAAKTIAYDRGQITAKSASSITLKRADGASVTVGVDASTKVKEKGEDVSVDTLQVGEGAMFFSSNGQAFLIRCVKSGGDKAAGKQQNGAAKQKRSKQ